MLDVPALRASSPRRLEADGDAAAAQSQRESRALTSAAALRRLGLLAPPAADAGGSLRVTVAGADRNEGVYASAAAAAAFAPLAAAAAREGVPAMRLLLLGPAVPPRPPRAAHFAVSAAGALRSFDDAADAADGADGEGGASAAHAPLSLRVVMAHGLLCDAASPPRFAPGCDYDSDGDSPLAPPAAVFAFNAGVWGYAAWADGIAACCAQQRAPVVVTAYSLAECAADARVLRRKGLVLAGGPEANPFASRRPWAPAGAPADGVPRFENAAWLCAVARDSRWAPQDGQRDQGGDDSASSSGSDHEA